MRATTDLVRSAVCFALLLACAGGAHAEAVLAVQGRIHFNTNVSSFETARAFYGNLGFETVAGFPDTNTLEMAQALGIDTPTEYDGSRGEWAGGYLLHGELIGLGGFGAGVVDLIEFTIPRNDAPPYARLNHLGFSHAAIHTADIEADYAQMSANGVHFVGPPTKRSDGLVFAFFTDPDGTFYELVEVAEARTSEVTHFVELGHVGVNVSDFDRSLAWYTRLGYEVTRQLPSNESAEVGAAMGFDGPLRIRGVMLVHRIDGSELELVRWLEPFDPEPPYQAPVNHIGIHRLAYITTDMAGDVAALEASGVEFLSAVTPCCSGPDSSGSIVAFYDPDGAVVELTEQTLMRFLLPIMRWWRDLFE